MSAVRVYVRGIDKVKSLRTVIGCYDIKCISILYRYPFKSLTKVLRKFILGITQFLWHTAPEIISECSIHHRGKGHLTQRPYRPGSLSRRKELRISIHVCCVCVNIPAVKGLVNLCLQVFIIHLCHPIEVREFSVDVVYDLGFRRMFGE